ncbi:hypothetical protein [Streptomyces sp. PA5.6]|uniref:hypothetical protein n=1 Tax=Streptomyces sp. PA5.6 TaxID=3035651 RepID=UPI003904B48D
MPTEPTPRRTPKQQLLHDLMQGAVPATVALPDGYGAEPILEATHERIRHLTHVAATDTEGAPFIALRTAADRKGSQDFTKFLYYVFKPDVRHSAAACSTTQESFDEAFPGVVHIDEPLPEGASINEAVSTLYARGSEAVLSLLAFLKAGCDAMPVPNWAKQNDRQEMLLLVDRLVQEGRSDDAKVVLQAFEASHADQLKEEE